MPAILLLILPYLKKLWLPICIGLAFIGTYIYAHHQGYKSCEAKMNQAIIDYTVSSNKELAKLQNRINELKAQIGNKPSLTDNENSCILSNNPITTECVK